MKILAIETSTPTGSVALAEDGELLSDHAFHSERSHNSQIFAPLGELLEDGIDGIVIGTGPGSYTGVRIGIAAAIGIALARGIPMVGLSSIWSVDVEDGDYAVVGDARRGSYYWCDTLPELVSLDELGTRAAAWGKTIFTFDATAPIPEAVVTMPQARRAAKDASLFTIDKLNELASHPVEPVYLRAAFVTTPRKLGKTLK